MRFGFREGWAYGGVVLGRCGISSVRCGLRGVYILSVGWLLFNKGFVVSSILCL